MVIDFAGISDIREMLLSLPLTQVMFTVFLAACAIGAACTLVGRVLRAAPDTVRDLLAARTLRKAAIQGPDSWIEGHARVRRGRK